jgi:glutathione S-transferase
MVSQAMVNPEDTFFSFLWKKLELKTDDDVERVRRAHLNDLENILAFILISLLFILSQPNEMFAAWLFRIVGIARIAHSIIYVCKVPQPFRAIFFYITYIITLFMALSSIVYFFKI